MSTRIEPDDKRRIVNRLKRLEGQVRGLQRMVEEDRDCRDILTLAAGVRRALDASTDAVLEQYLTKCGSDLSSGDVDPRQVVDTVRLARG